jgi:hypothetical protein
MHLERIGLDVAARRQPLQQGVDGHQPDAARARGSSASAARRAEVMSGCAEKLS